MSQESQNGRHVIRHGVLVVAGLVSAVGVLTACSTKAVPYDANEEGTAIIAGADTTEIPITPTATAISGTTSGSSGSATNAIVLSTTSAVPVGGGIVVTADQIVVTQPVKNEFKAFSTVCSQSGATATAVADGAIDCSSQGAKFSISTGDPVAGPIKTPLTIEKITVTGGKIELVSS